MLVSIGLSKLMKGAYECGWYMLTFTVDTTVGTTVAYYMLKQLEKLAIKKDWTSLTTSGSYG